MCSPGKWPFARRVRLRSKQLFGANVRQEVGFHTPIAVHYHRHDRVEHQLGCQFKEDPTDAQASGRFVGASTSSYRIPLPQLLERAAYVFV
jgi:hypothetical protein